jgi:uncharacterized repeat protein (TIGR02543 family)
MLLITEGSNVVARVNEITGGLFNGVVGVQVDLGGEIGTISGGKISANQGILNVGKIGKICGDTEINGTNTYGIYNYNYYANFNNPHYYGTIGEISDNAIISGNNYGIANAGQINLISGGTLTGKSYGISNSGAINLISGGVIIGGQYAIYCGLPMSGGQVGVNGVLGTISGGVFWGKTNNAFRLLSELQLEPGLNTNKGHGRYQSGIGQIFNNENLVIYPDGGYFMSVFLTEPVAGIDGVVFRFLTLDDSQSIEYTITYELNGGVNAPSNPKSYTEKDLPVAIKNPTKIDYIFNGWMVKFATGTIGDPKFSYEIPKGTTGDITLTALWLHIDIVDTYTVVYNGNGYTGGSVPVDNNSPYVEGTQVTVLGQGNMIKNNFTFLGWSTDSTATCATFTACSAFIIHSDMILYAVWAENTYTVTYQPGTHGTFKEQTTNGLHYGDPTPTAPTVTGETGWTFTGWLPTPSATVTGNTIYIAQWTQKTSPTTTPSVTPPPTTAPPIQTKTPSLTPTPTVSPLVDSGDNSRQVWALVNLVLSIAGVVLSIIMTLYALLQRKQKNKQQLLQKNQGDKYTDVAGQHTGKRDGDQAVEKKQRQQRYMWLATAIIAGIAGVIVFLLTEDMSHTMVMIDKWTIVNGVIFIIEIIAITFTVKHKKDNINNGRKEQEWSNTT